MRRLVGRYIWHLDDLLHLLRVPHRNICGAADITVGWGPGAADWKTSQTWFLRWFLRWYWQGRCQQCGGKGVLHLLHPREGDVPCFGCGGKGTA